MSKTKLREHASAQCHVVKGDRLDFISYTTRVISIWREGGKRFVECTGTYSATTRKQMAWFLKEYAPDLTYYDMKAIVGKGAVAM
jgi:hypothetical protein